MKIKKPFVFINTAMTLDGKISTFKSKQVRISNELDMERVDKLRAESDAILVGMNTVVTDDPKLNVKNEELRRERIKKGLPENPIKVTLGGIDRIKLNSDFLNYGNCEKIIFTINDSDPQKIEKLNKKATVYVMEGEINLKGAVRILKQMGIDRLMIEGGGETNFSFLKERLVDEIYIALAPKIFGGRDAPTAVDGDGFLSEDAIELELIDMENLEDLIILRYRVNDTLKYI
ncbi:MAG TPA: 2,5-diamino-6-(ribosylamino)-4(3H)-pyrimidinone 5'-phosphate reductase [Candidatus Altiarchaeales archaeon]|nr:2,5-diamino-6-(ribosylamino)-4(3H)-pyrimidinone 5'-phosphate reductase [Candidatus Altiarchaeales archaeon]